MKKFLLIAVSGFVLAGCTLPFRSDEKMEEKREEGGVVQQTQAPVVEKKEVKADRVIEVIGKSYVYNQKEIRVKKGESVAVNFTSMEGLHDFVIDELNVRTAKLKDDASEMVMIPTDKVGTFAFYCSVGQHRKMGMEGTLIIE